LNNGKNYFSKISQPTEQDGASIFRNCQCSFLVSERLETEKLSK